MLCGRLRLNFESKSDELARRSKLQANLEANKLGSNNLGKHFFETYDPMVLIEVKRWFGLAKVLQLHSCCLCQRGASRRTPSLTAPGVWEKKSEAARIYVQNRSSGAAISQPISAVVTSSWPISTQNGSPLLSSHRMGRKKEDVTQSQWFYIFLLFSQISFVLALFLIMHQCFQKGIFLKINVPAFSFFIWNC